MDIRKSPLESSDGKQDKWYIFDERNFVVSEFYLPKIYEEDFIEFLKSKEVVKPK